MDIKLYRNVFNNLYLNKLIYQFVRGNSVLEWNIKELLKRKEYSKFDTLFNYNFNIISETIKNQNGIKRINDYWFYKLSLPTKGDIKELLKYQGLGFERFLQFYNEFKNEELVKKNISINHAVKSGNMEILQFLFNQGYEYKPVENLDYQAKHFDCGNNLDVFNFIIEFTGLLTNTNFQNSELHNEILEYFSKLGYSNIYQTLIPLVNFDQVLKICFKNLDKELVKEFIKYYIVGPTTDLKTIRHDILKFISHVKKFILSDDEYNILKMLTDNSGIILNELIEKKELYKGIIQDDQHIYEIKNNNNGTISEKYIYSVKLYNMKSDEIKSIVYSLIHANQYHPNTLEEFKFIYENYLDIISSFFFSELINHLPKRICNLEYFSYFFDIYFDYCKPQREQDMERFYRSIHSCLNSTYEIALFILNKIDINKISNLRIIPRMNQILTCVYFGNLETYKLLESFPKPLPVYLNSAVVLGNLDIVKYILSNNKQMKIHSRNLFLCKHYQTFKYIISNDFINRFEFIENVKSYENGDYYNYNLDIKFKKLLLKYRLSKSKTIFENLSCNDIKLVQLFISEYCNLEVGQDTQSFINLLPILINSNFKVFNYLLFQNSISNYLIFKSSSSSEINKINLIQSLLKNNIKKLIYILINSPTELLDIKFQNLIINESISLFYSTSTTSTSHYQINSIISINQLIYLNNQNRNQEFFSNLIFNLILFKNQSSSSNNNNLNFEKLDLSYNLKIYDFLNYLKSNDENINNDSRNTFYKNLSLLSNYEIDYLNKIGLDINNLKN